MTMNPFAPASKGKGELKLRMALAGPPGSGKTWSALRIAAVMLGGDDFGDFGVKLPRRIAGEHAGLARIAFIDTERGSARKYSDDFPSDVEGQALFDVMELDRNDQGAVDPLKMIQAIQMAAKYGYEFVVIDSLSHAWEGILDIKDRKDRSGGNSYTNWRDVTPLHNNLVDAILDYPGHVITCMRVKMDTVIEEDPNKPGKTRVRKLGLKPIQRDGVDFEFDVVFDMTYDNGQNIASISKSRCHPLRSLISVINPGHEIAQILNEWLATGVEVDAPMTRDTFTIEMGKLGFEGNDAIAAFLRENNLINIGGARKYNIMLEDAKSLAPINTEPDMQPVPASNGAKAKK